MTLIELIKRYGDLRESSPIENECGSPVYADKIDAEAAQVLTAIEATIKAMEEEAAAHRETIVERDWLLAEADDDTRERYGYVLAQRKRQAR